MVSYNANRYHVPPEAIGIFDDDRLLITYSECTGKHRWVTDAAVIEQILAQRHSRQPLKPYGRTKGKATRGLVDASLFAQVQHRPLSVYDRFAQGGGPWTN